jgi:hypothetical protein
MQFFPQQENREAPRQVKKVLSISQSSAGVLTDVFEGVFQRELPTNLHLTKTHVERIDDSIFSNENGRFCVLSLNKTVRCSVRRYWMSV